MSKAILSLCVVLCFALTGTESIAIPKMEYKRFPTLVVSFDGMQSGKFEQFLEENPDANFHEIINNGVKAEYMIPSFPTLTFPNHFTLVTGLNIESHGIVANSIFDPEADKKINFIGDTTSVANDAKWWSQGEPIWLTAKNQGLKSGSFFWTGSEVITRTPDVWMTYNDKYPQKVKIDDVVNWISKLKMDITFLYFDEPDHEGHSFGSDSPQYMEKIKQVDEHIGYLINSLKALDLYESINLVVLSDHGMTQMATKSTILVKDFVNTTLINSTRTVYGVTSNIHPVAGSEQEVYDALKKIPNARTFWKNEIPEDLYYSKNSRIAPIIVTCDDGFTMSTVVQSNKGNHGFDNKFTSMRTIFAATGPNFKKKVVLSPFKNTNVYPLLCALTQIECRPHNGSLSTFDNALIMVPVQAPSNETGSSSTTTTTTHTPSTTDVPFDETSAHHVDTITSVHHHEETTTTTTTTTTPMVVTDDSVATTLKDGNFAQSIKSSSFTVIIAISLAVFSLIN